MHTCGTCPPCFEHLFHKSSEAQFIRAEYVNSFLWPPYSFINTKSFTTLHRQHNYGPWLVVWLLLESSSMQSQRIRVAILVRKTRDIFDICYIFDFSSQPNKQPKIKGWRTVSYVTVSSELSQKRWMSGGYWLSVRPSVHIDIRDTTVFQFWIAHTSAYWIASSPAALFYCVVILGRRFVDQDLATWDIDIHPVICESTGCWAIVVHGSPVWLELISRW